MPCCFFWDHGNEGGWNTANDGEFAQWDLQQRPVLHPWEKFSGVDTNHYEVWDSHVKLSAGPMLYLPTEFLHGLYDGGGAAGLRDYWDVMRRSPTVAGGFLWAFADEGVARTDQGGRIDTAGNLAPDGIVGPRGEKEGSFSAVKEIWSPVRITAPVDAFGSLPADWDGTLSVANGYQFTNLKDCSFEWRRLFAPDERTLSGGLELASGGQVPGPEVAPGQSGSIRLPLPTAPIFNALQVTARDPAGAELWTWSWGPSAFTYHRAGRPPAPDFEETSTEIIVTGAGLELRWSRTTGLITAATFRGRRLPLQSGPRLIGYRRVDRRFESVLPTPAGVATAAHREGDQVVVTMTSEFPKASFRWTLAATGDLVLTYDYVVDGEFDLFGIQFDLVPDSLLSKRWFGRGPYRVWRNRMEGGRFDLHEVAFNDATPGETYAYPEFNGYFRDWRWLSLATKAGRMVIEQWSGIPFFGLGKPRDGVDGLLDLPDVGLSFLEVIPAMRNKFYSTDQLGPQSRTPTVKGGRARTLVFRFALP